jgi:hypothetical protein
MSEEKNKNSQTPQERPKPNDKPNLTNEGFGDSRAQQERLRKAFEIPPKPPTPKKDSEK